MAGIDTHNKLYVPFDGLDGSNTFIDKGVTGHTLTAGGNAKLDAGQHILVGTSLYLDGTTDYVSTLNSGDFRFLTGDFFIEMYVRLATGYTANNQHFLSLRAASGNRGFDWRLSTTYMQFNYGNNGAGWTNQFDSTWEPTANTWYHIAVCRNGADLLMFVDGEQIGATHDIGTDTIESTAPLYIGTSPYNSFAECLQGYVANLRISDTARHTTTFTPPIAPYRRDL